MPLYHLVYFSTRANLGEGDLEAIEAVSARNNARDQLTGCLFLDDRYFFQVVEGRRPLLSALLARLIRDTRHSDVVIADFTGIDQRAFASWNDKSIRLDVPGIRETYARFTGRLSDPTQLSGSQIWDMLESMAQIAEEAAAGPRRAAIGE